MKITNDIVLRYGIIMLLCIFLQTSVVAQTVQDTISKPMNYPILSFRPDLKGINKPKNFFNKFESNALPFFCRIEHKIETGSKIAFRFRLGDLNYVNMLENKR